MPTVPVRRHKNGTPATLWNPITMDADDIQCCDALVSHVCRVLILEQTSIADEKRVENRESFYGIKSPGAEFKADPPFRNVMNSGIKSDIKYFSTHTKYKLFWELLVLFII